MSETEPSWVGIQANTTAICGEYNESIVQSLFGDPKESHFPPGRFSRIIGYVPPKSIGKSAKEFLETHSSAPGAEEFKPHLDAWVDAGEEIIRRCAERASTEGIVRLTSNDPDWRTVVSIAQKLHKFADKMGGGIIIPSLIRASENELFKLMTAANKHHAARWPDESESTVKE